MDYLCTHYIAMICGAIQFTDPRFQNYYRKFWDEYGPKIEIN